MTFCCLSNRQFLVPTKEELQELKIAGLGKKRHTFMNRNGDHQYVQEEMENLFPKLENAKGNFLFFKGGSGTTKQLSKVKLGKEGKQQMFILRVPIACYIRQYQSK